MSRSSNVSAEYVEARRVLLDALGALGEQLDALVLSGAQAVYIRTGRGSLPVAEHTTDGDLTVDPSRLEDAPLLGELMEGAGFRLAQRGGRREPGIWHKTVRINGVEAPVPIDLLVPVGVAPAGGRRGARLGPHGNLAARKTPGLEAALIDNDELWIEALDPADRRHSRLRVAGVAALLVAKAHKLADRVNDNRPERLNDKDASDVVRLLQTSQPIEVAATLRALQESAGAGKSTAEGIDHLFHLFGNRGGSGIMMASRALRQAVPEARVRAVCVAYCEELRPLLDER